MERIISEQDKIRRAEEIANRRRGTISARSINISTEKKKMPYLTKVFIQTIVSMCIFGLAYFFNQNSPQVIENIKPILAQDINFEELYNRGNEFFTKLNEEENSNGEKSNEEGNSGEKNSEGGENQETNDQVNETNQVINEQMNETAGIGGSDEEVILSQDEQDIAYIKANVSLIVPTTGTVTSGYGKREPTDIISANHAGIDIGATVGTEIIAAMEGTVEEVSSYGDYGNHLKITNGEVSTLYAHCSKILVNKGDYIAQGQKIAEVGNTGRTTGPHLHFEISRSGRTVDPAQILTF